MKTELRLQPSGGRRFKSCEPDQGCSRNSSRNGPKETAPDENEERSSVLDDPRPSKSLIYLRTLLIRAGALSRDTPATRRLTAWATQTISETPVDYRQMLRTYTRWVLLRRASRESSGDIAGGAARHVKASLRGLLAFLDGAEQRRTPLRALTQAQIEGFISLRTARRWLPQFLTWAAERGITPDLDISALPRWQPTIRA